LSHRREVVTRRTVFELRKNARVATGSLRRKAQLLSRRPDYEIVDIRGNVPTRISKLRESNWDGMILAYAGISRLGLENQIEHIISTNDMLPAPGQGALAIETRESDSDVTELLSVLEHTESRLCTQAEREILHSLGGGCQLPLGTYVHKIGTGEYSIEACIANPNGKNMLSSKRLCDETRLTQTAREIAEDFLFRGGKEMIDALLGS
ncbi:MAG: hydroxymethylbilane synthase, partial [Ignavibacteriota bacterium]